jgi:hypothetical protein
MTINEKTLSLECEYDDFARLLNSALLVNVARRIDQSMLGAVSRQLKNSHS